MSFITGTSVELLYSSIATSTQLNTFTTEDNLQKTLPPVIIPAGFFYNSSAVSKSLRLRATGRLGTTSAPTFTFTLRALTSTTWSAGGISLGATAALTAGTTQTLAPFFIDVDIVCESVGIGGTTILRVLGQVTGPLAFASPFGGTIPANNTAFRATTYDNSVTNYLFLSAACGTSSVSNLIQLEMLKIYGEN